LNSERRKHPRYPFIADAEVTDLATDAKFRVRTSDLSVGGCFLKMDNPTPAGTNLHVKIFRMSGSFEARGRAAFVMPNSGMGIAFTRVEERHLRTLERWLAEIAR
jgi:c-di-GMP-binding flagellar brake protein YcgR